MPLDHVPLMNASLAAVCIDSACYGIFLVFSVASIYLLGRRDIENSYNGPGRPTRRFPRITPILAGAIALVIIVTAHWILVVHRLFEALVYFENGTEPLLFWLSWAHPTESAKLALFFAALLIGDAMIIYRCWVVWGYNKAVIIFPCTTLLGLAVCGATLIYQLSLLPPGDGVFDSIANRWVSSDFAFTLSTNIYSTAMIAYKLFRSASRTASTSLNSHTKSALGIVVESAAIYTLWTIFFCVSYEARSALQFIGVEVLPTMAGIAYMLINLRVGLGWAERSFHNQTTGANSSYHLRPLAVAVSTSQAVDHEPEYGYAKHGTKDRMMIMP